MVSVEAVGGLARTALEPKKASAATATVAIL